jgi:hypothetical protein
MLWRRYDCPDGCRARLAEGTLSFGAFRPIE